ncbi:helix-turn-helix domain-containing protein [Streptomyces caniscabiei]|uniref:PucR family transcriptional regulator n=1 Tax=Streptomyces caniscabiei TaxID=2746961 RepID=UPI0029A5F47A|nr:helix-turn-helix domain-containing protein [Streptomyces caniscabiei]MDX2605101.1 helix-turn-helix domain-containing protein [Streptomyces caniscabiei]MDX2735509.1 helix-turn-helix domain-containing protein [Streptomyces caniscabiei]MDX2781010.1 helix-turn-helix domain-containing protein [Streptomyces caniscabiei]
MAAPVPPYGVPNGPGADQVPPELVKLLREHLKDVADQVEEEVCRQVPEYASRSLDGASRALLRSGVVQALTLFVDHIADPRGRGESITAIYHELGRGEALEGHSLETLQSALRVGGLHAWRLLGRTTEELGLDSSVMARLGELAFRTVHEVAEAAAAGYAEGQLRSTDELERRRGRLLALLLGDRPVLPEAVRDLAHGARWSVPTHVAVVVLASSPDRREERPLAAAGALVDMESRPPRMLVPDPGGSGGFGGRAFTLALRGRPAAIGPSVPLTEAARSLRWATRALGLMGRGILPRQGVVRCADHLSTLLLHSDEPMLEQLRSQVLAPLDSVAEGTRGRLAETLLVWLLGGSNVPDVAARLHIHPQTVRYRLRQLEKLFGDALHDPDSRLDLILALRAEALRDDDSSTA